MNNNPNGNEKPGFTVTEVYVLKHGGQLLQQVAKRLDKAPTQNEVTVHYMHPVAHALAGDDQTYMTSEPDWEKTGDRQYTWDGDGGWLLTWMEPAEDADGWYLIGEGGSQHLGTNLIKAMEFADEHITALREDPMDEHHWREDSMPRPHAGVLNLHTDQGPVVLPADSVMCVRIVVTDDVTGDVVTLEPGWPKPAHQCDHAETGAEA